MTDIDPHRAWVSNGSPPLAFDEWSALPSEVKNQFPLEEIRWLAEDSDWTFEQHQNAERFAVDFGTEVVDIGHDWNDPEFLVGAKSFKANGNGHSEPLIRPFVRKIKSIDEFTGEYSPINYTIDGALPVSSIYGVTGKRGSAKTALLTAVSLAVLTGNKDIIGFDVEKGRVAYVILENPTDFRMRLATALYIHCIDPKDISKQFVILDMKLPHNEIIEQLTRDAEENGPLQLVCYDTYQAGFAGAQFNDNAEALKHTQDLRMLTRLPGKPSAARKRPRARPARGATRPGCRWKRQAGQGRRWRR